MSEVVDARGLSCPQPVLVMLKKTEAMGTGKVDILVDTETSMENVSRAAGSKGWSVNVVSESDEEYRIELAKG
nr:sulfurtransferase TusA family protein [uncultured Pseudodesulfovibrio sp.]